MARIVMTFLGLILLGLGAWATYAWWPSVKAVLLGLIALGLLLMGLVVLIFAISEISGARQPRLPPHGEANPPIE